MTERQSDILVYSENSQLIRELLAEAQSKAPGRVGLAVISDCSDDLTKYGDWGANSVWCMDHQVLNIFELESYTEALATIIRQVNPRLVLVGGTKQGLELSARTAEKMEIGLASWCVDFDLPEENEQIAVECMIYSGLGTATYLIESSPAMVTVAKGVFEPGEPLDKTPEVEKLEVTLSSPRVNIIEQKEKLPSGTRLEDAAVIVDVGQGFEKKEDLVLAEDLAKLLGGQVSCSRPLSSERDWFPEWIGLSGARLSPQLCFTIGVSGAIQHMIGIRDSGTIVAVNQDEYAGVHLQADYGIIADLYEFIPALLQVLRERSVSIVV